MGSRRPKRLWRRVVLELTPDRQRVRRALFGLHGACRYGAVDTTTRFGQIPVRGGAFSLTRQWADTSGGERLQARSTGRGAIDATTASGSYHELDTYLSRRGRVTDRCRIPRFRWTATSSPPAGS